MAKETPDWMTENDDGSVTVTLSRPREIGGAKVGHITMREPLVRDQMAVKGKADAIEQETALIANLCQLAPDDISAMPMRDYTRLQRAYVSFID